MKKELDGLLALTIPAPLAFDETKPIQVLRVGKWEFDDYGEVEITPDDIKLAVQNFKDNIRGQKIPINIEHEHTLGAIGWVDDMWASDDGKSAYIRPTWTDQGKDLVITKKSFAYSSPEYYRRWKNPETKANHRSVISGVAVTNYPRLKNMEAIAASETLPGTRLGNVNTPATTLHEMDGSTASVLLLSHAIARSIPPMDDTRTQTPQGGESPKKKEKKPKPPAELSEMQERLVMAEKRASEAMTKLSEMQVSLAEQKALLAVERSARVQLECKEQIGLAQRKGLITPAQAEVYLAELPKLDQGARDAWIKDILSRPVALPLTELGSGEEGSDDGTNSQLAKMAESLQAKSAKKGKPLSARDAFLMAGKQLVTKGAQ